MGIAIDDHGEPPRADRLYELAALTASFGCKQHRVLPIKAMKYVEDLCRSRDVKDGTTIIGQVESPLPRNFKSCSAISAFNCGTDDLFAAYRTGLA